MSLPPLLTAQYASVANASIANYSAFRSAVLADGGTIYDESYSFGLFVEFFEENGITGLGGTFIQGMPASKVSVVYAWNVQNQTLISIPFVRNSEKRTLGKDGFLVTWLANFPAFEWNADGSYRGLSVEPGATNQIRNNSGQGAVAGTPGTLPTNWGETLNGLTREVVGTGTGNGVDYVDIRLHGTASATTVDIRPETLTQIVATPSQQWTVSSWLKVVASPTPPVSYQFRILSLTSVGATIAGHGTTILSVTGTLSRFSESVTLSSDVTTARVVPLIRANIVNGQSYDFTIRIGFPQMETGSVATSVIRTTNATASRLADSVPLTGAGSLIGQSAGTIYVEAEIQALLGTTVRNFIEVSDGTADNRYYITFTSAANNTLRGGLVRGGGAEKVDFRRVITSVGIIKSAFAFSTSDSSFFIGGTEATEIVDASFSFGVTLSQINIGTNRAGLLPINGWIRSAVLFTQRLPNATLASLTA